MQIYENYWGFSVGAPYEYAKDPCSVWWVLSRRGAGRASWGVYNAHWKRVPLTTQRLPELKDWYEQPLFEVYHFFRKCI